MQQRNIQKYLIFKNVYAYKLYLLKPQFKNVCAYQFYLQPITIQALASFYANYVQHQTFFQKHSTHFSLIYIFTEQKKRN